MSNFMTDLFISIFTPGPTSTLITATNASFLALQLVLFALLIATYSIHFLILSFLSAGLWWAINWFVSELRLQNERERKGKQTHAKDGDGRESVRKREVEVDAETETETEVEEVGGQRLPMGTAASGGTGLSEPQGMLRKRASAGDASGETSTDSEWEKVDEDSDKGR
ncbi:MAG: hypothetical protein M1812_001556 [Candelaria pacifica]|nr:MAG: hypothetical protein M1812_001556 [Candelaria pacifica]